MSEDRLQRGRAYVARLRARGYDAGQIRTRLWETGWTEPQISALIRGRLDAAPEPPSAGGARDGATALRSRAAGPVRLTPAPVLVLGCAGLGLIRAVAIGVFAIRLAGEGSGVHFRLTAAPIPQWEAVFYLAAAVVTVVVSLALIPGGLALLRGESRTRMRTIVVLMLGLPVSLVGGWGSLLVIVVPHLLAWVCAFAAVASFVPTATTSGTAAAVLRAPSQGDDRGGQSVAPPPLAAQGLAIAAIPFELYRVLSSVLWVIGVGSVSRSVQAVMIVPPYLLILLSAVCAAISAGQVVAAIGVWLARRWAWYAMAALTGAGALWQICSIALNPASYDMLVLAIFPIAYDLLILYLLLRSDVRRYCQVASADTMRGRLRPQQGA